MSLEPELDILAGTLRSLGGDRREHTMDSRGQKHVADAILESTPLEVAQLLCRQILDETKLEVLELMHQRQILTDTQYDLIARGIGQIMKSKKLINAQRLQGTLLVQRVIERAGGKTRGLIEKILEPRIEEDGTFDFLA